MRVSLDVELKDIPGQLIQALEPISQQGGNFISVLHLREEVVHGRWIPVHVIAEIETPEKLEKVLEELEARDIRVSKVGEVGKKERITLGLVGHIVDTDLGDTIDRINSIQGVLVSDVKLAMPHPEKESSGLMQIDVDDPQKVKQVLERLEEIGREKNLLLIRSRGV